MAGRAESHCKGYGVFVMYRLVKPLYCNSTAFMEQTK